MTPREARGRLARFLEENELGYSRLTARTIRFADLARSSSVFVTIHGWEPSPEWAKVKQFAHDNGFCVEAA